ncbi:MAG TPA: hypothetical protein PK095_15135, partial [Myxococcota bacterium]|nr:hypothetical protein [Myxococcota bacterium]
FQCQRRNTPLRDALLRRCELQTRRFRRTKAGSALTRRFARAPRERSSNIQNKSGARAVRKHPPVREEFRMASRPFAWEKSYPPGVRWDAPIRVTTLGTLVDEAAASFGERPAFEPLSWAYLTRQLVVGPQP